MHQPKLCRLKVNGELTGGIIFKHPCKDCGYPHAAFGSDVNILGFLKSHAEKQPNHKLLGEWTCGMNKCEGKGNVHA